ncbi:MAG: hypothetical protein QW751_01660 [Candidatus Aenigmatarchaeota archaeon]|nr:hypothetical protein [Candidatus Aenigmarchaeota archaeon]
MRGSIIFGILMFSTGLAIMVLLFGVFLRVPVFTALYAISESDPSRVQEETAALLTAAAYAPGNYSWGIKVKGVFNVELFCKPNCNSPQEFYINVTPECPAGKCKPYQAPPNPTRFTVPPDISVQPRVLHLYEFKPAYERGGGTNEAVPGILRAVKTGNTLTIEFEEQRAGVSTGR